MSHASPPDESALVARIVDLTSPLEPLPTDTAPLLPRLEGIRAVLFDVYGTLVVSASGDSGVDMAEDDRDAFCSALAAVGLHPAAMGEVSGADLMTAAIRADHARRRAEGVDYPEVDILAIWGQVAAGLPPGTLSGGGLSAERLRRLAVEYECRSNPVWPMPGLSEVLDELRGRGLALGIVSNAQFYTPLMLRAFLHRDLPELGFDPQLCAWSYRALEAKPSTRLYRQVLAGLQRRGVTAEEALYVGNDMLKDIWPASVCGLRTALFAGDRRSLRLREDDPRCLGVAPDLVLTDLRQLGEVLL
jgi:putative hydrolase of the HAD superfamily